MAQPDPTTVFDKLLNFRDVATIVNQHYGQTYLKTGLFYRSARPDDASAADQQKLQKAFNIKTIIDLRSKTEHMEAAKRSSGVSFTIPDINYTDVNLNGKGFERHLVWQLSYINLARLISYMLLGYRLEGISIIGKNVLQPRGLIGLGKDTIQHSKPEIKQVIDILAEPKSYPVLIHCTQGKDRTGLMVILVLLLCEVDVTTISRDYTISERELKPEFEERMAEIRSIGLDETFAKCPEDFVGEINQYITSNYGSIQNYLLSIGVTSDQLQTIRSRLLA